MDDIRTEPVNFAPLEAQLRERMPDYWQHAIPEWMWMFGQGRLEFYKHNGTRRYLILDQEGAAYAVPPVGGTLKPVDFNEAYFRALGVIA